MIRSCRYIWDWPTPFEVAKPGDVGHDIPAHVDRSDMNILDRIVSKIFFKGAPIMILWPVFGTRFVKSTLHIILPSDVWASIRPRSSTMKAKIQVLGGTIDTGYTGEYLTILHNFGFVPRVIRHGHRYAQVVFHPAVKMSTKLIGVPEFQQRASVKHRGTDGFGSTGR